MSCMARQPCAYVRATEPALCGCAGLGVAWPCCVRGVRTYGCCSPACTSAVGRQAGPLRRPVSTRSLRSLLVLLPRLVAVERVDVDRNALVASATDGGPGATSHHLSA